MTNKVTNYQCPACTGPLAFKGETGKMECQYCGTTYEVDLIEKLYEDKIQVESNAGKEPEWNFDKSEDEWTEEEIANMKAYNCPSCGAQLICDNTIVATECPYCGNPSIVSTNFAGHLKPDYLIPFKISKKEAVNALKEYYKGKLFLPKGFAESNHIEEVKGTYVPFWLFNGEAEAAMRFLGTRSHSYVNGNEEVTVTEYYRVVREGNLKFNKIPVDGASSMPDSYMDAIEPFDYGEIQPFMSAYLPGYFANKYDQSVEECSQRVNRRIRESTEDAFRSTASGYLTLIPEYSDINLKQGDVKYAFIPTWILNTKWKDKTFLFIINGQTGKLVGDLPVDRGKYWSCFFGIALPLMAILWKTMF
ncbi:MAG: hypothetical protein ACRDA4_02390 [Filifactoraceae bacterium]